jgi:dienelactone hydrolase
MPTVLLHHHVQGPTPGVTAFADALRAAGHTVHTPDLLDGKQFASIPDGMAYVQTLGFPTIIARGAAAAESLPADIVYLGMSMGVLPAQYLAQTRPGARAAISSMAP